MRKLLPLLLPVLLSGLLSGCWSGEAFYDATESVAAIPAGTYRVVDVGGVAARDEYADFGKRVTIQYHADGRALVESSGEGDENTAILVKLGDAPGLYVVQSDLGAQIPGIGASLFALVNLTPSGYQVAVPRCDQKRLGKSRAVTSGLLVGKPVCRFDNRADLETALIHYAQDPISWTEYRRVKR